MRPKQHSTRCDDPNPFSRNGRVFSEEKLFQDTDSYGLSFRWVMRMAGDSALTRPYAQHPWVHACVSAIAKAVSSAPLVIQRQTRPGEYEPVESGPLYELLRRPNKLMSQRKFLKSVTQTQQLYGETMILMLGKSRNGSLNYIDPSDRIQVPAELWPVRGDLLEEVLDENTHLPKAWKMQTTQGMVEIPAESVIHLAEANPYNPIRGMGPMQAAYRTAAKDFVLDRYDEALLQNSGSPGGILSVEGHLTDADQRAIADAWREAHGRPDSHRKTAVLPQGTKYEEIGFSPQEMEFQSMRDWNRETIMAIFGVTKPIIGLTEGLNYASSMSAFRTFYEVTVVPFMDFVIDELETKFLSRLIGAESEYQLSFDLSGVAALREDADSKVERTLELFTKGGRTFNEAADLAGWDIGDAQLENADEAYISSTLLPVGSSGSPAEGRDGDPFETEAPDPSLSERGFEAKSPACRLGGETFDDCLSRKIPEIMREDPEMDQDQAVAIAASLCATECGAETRAVDPEEVDEVWSRWKGLANMTASELEAWSENPCSRKASLDPSAVINRNLRLLRKNKGEWDARDVRDANRAISFISRMRGAEQGEPVSEGCPSKRDISLKNWAHDPRKGRRSLEDEIRTASFPAHLSTVEARTKYWEDWDASVQAAEDRMAKAVKRPLRDIVLAYRKRLREVAQGPWEGTPKPTGKSVRKSVYTEAEIQRLLGLNYKLWSDEVYGVLEPKIAETFVVGAEGIFSELEGGRLLTASDPYFLDMLASKEIVLRDISTNLINELQRNIVKILAEDDGTYTSLREAIYFTLADSEEYLGAALKGLGTRASRIARTESTTAANFGRQRQMLESGVLSNVWLAQPSAREHHAELNGEEVPVGDSFGYGLRYPGDPTAPVGEIVNCRCVLLPGATRTTE